MISMGGFGQNHAEVYIDLGTANTLVMTKDRGLVANEPSVVAYKELEGGRKRVLAVGNEAKVKLGRTSGNLTASFPLKQGVIADLDTTEAMIRYFLAKAKRRFSFKRPGVLISLPYGVSDVEKKAVKLAGTAAGAREVTLIEEPMAAAIGAGLPVHAPKGNMIIDIGGGTTEVAVISLFGVVHCEAVRVGGHAFDESICDYVRRRYNLIVGEPSAERLKIEIGSALPGDNDLRSKIRGVDFTTGLPKEISLSASEVHEAMSAELNGIIQAAKSALEQIPPDLVPDIIRDGAKLAGGGALIRGLDKRLSKELNIPVAVAEEPLLAIARGGREALKDPNLLERIALI